MKPGALLLLLAVAASQVDLHLSQVTELDISKCPMTFYGRSFSRVEVKFNPDSSLAVCFKNVPNEASQDCVLLENGGGSNSVKLTFRVAKLSRGSAVYRALPNIKNTSPCYALLLFKRGSSTTLYYTFFNFGSQAALQIRSFSSDLSNCNVIVTVGGSIVDSWSYRTSQKPYGDYRDLSSCIVSDIPVLIGSSIYENPYTCSSTVCSPSAVLTPVGSCGPLEVCFGNNVCKPRTFVCTVTGSTVIDFHSRVHSVQDRCVYALIKPQGSSGFELVAGFRELRHTNVSILDHLIITRSGVTMYLEQGGRVRVGDQTLNLNTTTQLLHGVELSKDQTGVTAKIPSSNMTIFFNGNTTHVLGPMEAVEGLCGNPTNQSQTTTLNDEKTIENGCNIQHNDTVNGTINCKSLSQHCEILKYQPFTTCHNYINPEPYEAACKNTFCRYPSVDGLICQFMAAYAKSCSLKGITLEHWREGFGCYDS